MYYEFLKFTTINFILLKYFKIAIATECVQKNALSIKTSRRTQTIVAQDTLVFQKTVMILKTLSSSRAKPSPLDAVIEMH